MSAPVNIVLGVLGAQGVLSAVDGVRNSLGGLLATVLGVSSAAAGLEHGLDLGGQLNDLSARTTQAGRDLVVLNRALDITGVGAGTSAQFIGLLQKSIAGLNEEGGTTGDIYKRLGLDPDKLKLKGVLDQVQDLTGAFSRITNPAERSALAMQLFGRSGAQMLQLFSDSTALDVAERQAGRLADRLGQDAVQFDDLGDRLSVAKVRLDEFWVVATEKAVPILGILADVIESINPAPLAAATGSVLSVFALVGGMKLAERLNQSVLLFATNPQISSAGQTFAQRFIAPLTDSMTNLFRTILPVAIAAIIAGAVVQAITQAQREAIAAEVSASNATASESQRQRDALRNAQSLADLDEQRKKTAADIAAIEALKKTQQIDSRTVYDSENGRSGRATSVPIFGLTPDQKQQLEELQRLQQVQNSARAQAIVAENKTTSAAADRLTKAKETVAELKKQAESYTTAAETARYAVAKDQEKLGLLDKQLERADATLITDTESARLAGDINAERSAQQKYDATILSIAKEKKDVEKSIADEKKRQLDTTAAQAEKAKQAELELLRARAEVAKFALEDRQLELQQQLAELSADYTRTEAEKWADRKANLNASVAAARQYLATMKEQRALATTDEGRQLGDANVHSAQQDLFATTSQLAQVGADPNNWVEQMRKGLADLRSEWGTLAQSIASTLTGTLRTAVDSVSAGISGMILGTTSWRDALSSVGNVILTSIVTGFVRMGVQWVAQQTVMAAASKALAAASFAATIPLASAQSAVWATPAILASIATMGAADGVGLVALQGALASAQLMAALPGFSEGGYTGNGNGIVHPREFVFSAPAVRNIGLDNLDALHRGALAPASQGSGGATAAGGRDRRIIVVAPDMVSARQMARDPEFENVIVDVMRRRRGEVVDS